MSRISDHIEAKSDQLNADDLLAGPRVITITRVTSKPKGAEQPVSIFYEGDNGKPWKPNKGMMRLLVACWGDNDDGEYIGRSLKLFRNPDVQWGGDPVGGIQIAAASHIDSPVETFLQVRKGKKARFRVEVLRPQQQEQPLTLDEARDLVRGAPDLPSLQRVWSRRDMAPFRDELGGDKNARKGEIAPPADGTQRAPATDNGGFDAP